MKFTGHGKHRAKERGITEKAITIAVLKPTSVFYDLTSSAQEIIDSKLKANVWVKIK